MKLCNFDDEKLNQLRQVQNHNSNEEQSVGFVNYKLEIRGKQNLESVSYKMVLNKSADLTIKNLSVFRKHKNALKIKELRLQWNQKMKVLEDNGFS